MSGLSSISGVSQYANSLSESLDLIKTYTADPDKARPPGTQDALNRISQAFKEIHSIQEDTWETVLQIRHNIKYLRASQLLRFGDIITLFKVVNAEDQRREKEKLERENQKLEDEFIPICEEIEARHSEPLPQKLCHQIVFQDYDPKNAKTPSEQKLAIRDKLQGIEDFLATLDVVEVGTLDEEGVDNNEIPPESASSLMIWSSKGGEDNSETLDKILTQLNVIEVKEEIPSPVRRALVERTEQIQAISFKFLDSFGPLILDGILSVINKFLEDENLQHSVASGASLPPESTPAVIEFIVANLKVIKKRIPTMGGQILLEKAIEFITPKCFKAPRINSVMHRQATALSLQAVLNFMIDLNVTTKGNGLDPQAGTQIFESMYQNFQVRYFKNEKRPDEAPSLDDLKILLREEIQSLIGVKVANFFELDNTIPFLLPYLSEHLIDKGLQPHTLYTVLLRAFKKYIIATDSVEDPLGKLCADPSLRTVEKINASQHSIDEITSLLTYLSEKTICLTTVSLPKRLEGFFEWLVTPWIKPVAAKIVSNLDHMADGVCMFLPFSVLNNFFFDLLAEASSVSSEAESPINIYDPQVVKRLSPSKDMVAIFENTEDQKAEALAALKQELHDAIDLRPQIDKFLENKFVFAAGAAKLVTPYTCINNTVRKTLFALIDNTPLMYLVVLYMLNEIKPALKEMIDGSIQTAS